MRTDLDRFMDFVIKLPNGCWEWQGFKTKRDQAQFWFKGKTRWSARVSLHLFKDFDLSSPLDACHKCDYPPCVNPEHLFPGTRQENIQDSVNKGRHSSIQNFKLGSISKGVV